MKIRYYGSAGFGTGYGVAAAELCMALIGAGADLELRPYGGGPGEKPLFEGDTAQLADVVTSDECLTKTPDAVIVHAQPLDCRKILRHAGIMPGGKTKCIAYTTWEGASGVSPEVARALRDFDQVWVPCTHNKRSFQAVANEVDPSKVRVVPHCFDEDGLADRRGERLPGSPYRFYFIGHWNGRKNPDGLIRAWTRTFSRDDDVELVIQSTKARGVDVMTAVQSVGAAGRERMAPIKINADVASEDTIRSLHRGADCFVSTSRWESWNLPAFHAMLAGRHIIVPSNMGSDDFLSASSAILVSSMMLVPAFDDVSLDMNDGEAKYVFSGPQGVSCLTNWLEPHLTAFARFMRTAYELKTRNLRVDYDVTEKFGRRAVGAFAMALLQGA